MFTMEVRRRAFNFYILTCLLLGRFVCSEAQAQEGTYARQCTHATTENFIAMRIHYTHRFIIITFDHFHT